MKNWLLAVTIVYVSGLAEAARDSDACDGLETNQLKRLCRKVESQEQYFEKMVDICAYSIDFFHFPRDYGRSFQIC